ncbi:MAG: viroplasmin family protein [Bacillota bacterium]
MSKKFYAIKSGKKTGIFTGNWKEIEKKYIKGFSNPQYKGFNTREEAEKYLSVPAKPSHKKERKEAIRKEQLEREAINKKKREEKEQAKKALEFEREKAQDIVFQANNEKHQELRKVKLVINCHQNPLGFYRSILIDEKTNKSIKVNPSPQFLDTSSNRAIIIGIIKEVSKLKTPCHIKIHSKTNFGYQIMVKGKKSPNSDKLDELKEHLLSNGHVIEEFIEDEEIMKQYFYTYR